MKIDGQKILITGAGGFIGSNLTANLVKKGANVKALVRYNSRRSIGLLDELPSEIKREIEIVAGDLRDSETILDIMKNIDIVFHLAALIAIPYSYLRPKEVVETNVMGTLNILSACKIKKVHKIIHTSTSEVYGTAQYVPIDEKHPLQAQSPYSASKIAADKIAESFYKSYRLPISTIRPFNTFGPGQSARAIIPTIISQALTNDNLYLGSLHPTRDFTFVDDTVNGFIKTAESENSVGEVINIGSSFEISIGDLARKICSLINKDVSISSEKERIRPETSEVERLLADNSKAKRLLGWTPLISLEEGLKTMINWMKDHLTKYQVDVYNI